MPFIREVTSKYQVLGEFITAKTTKTWQKELTPQQAIDIINEMHQGGWERKKFEDPYRVLQAKKYVLIQVPMDKIKDDSVTHPPVITNYASLKSDFPPIFFDIEGHIIDGFHRLEAAKKRGYTHILAYVGKGVSGVKDPSDWRGIWKLKPRRWLD